jgi:NhaA family Na+:H+ antiporter
LISRVWRPIARFLDIEAGGGIVLLACTLVALVAANSRWSSDFDAFWQTRLGFTVGNFGLHKPLLLWINDGLMTVFFFLVGLEIKRELVLGELRDPRKAALPAAAAIGGMIVPAAIYWVLLRNAPGAQGWGIPMATDIAFVVGLLAILGRRVPFGLKILLLTLAIVDDIGAVLVIAAAYTDGLALYYLIVAAIGFAICMIFNRIGVRTIGIYLLVGAVIWWAFLKSGIHPTVAGVLLGILTPANAWFGKRSLVGVLKGTFDRLRQDIEEHKEMRHHEDAVQLLTVTARETISPLDRLERGLHPWVAYGIMPLFALANAGVAVKLSALSEPVAVGVAAGLVMGKPLGILAFSWIAVKTGVAKLPGDVTWRMLVGGSFLAGIGFTMSLFIAGLALDGVLLSAAKISILVGSLVSAVLGAAILVLFTDNKSQQLGESDRHN